MRPILADVMLTIAGVLAKRATCHKLSVGCVLTDARGRIISAGYNGVPADFPHCNEENNKCVGMCLATHAEANALLSAGSNIDRVHTCWVTHSPCVHCTKLLVQTSCMHIIFKEPTKEHEDASSFWIQNGRKWHKITI